MKRNLLKKASAAAISAALVFSAMPVYASPAFKDGVATSTVAGTSTVVAPIYKVTVPTAIALTLDPMGLKGTDTVIASNYAIANLSNIGIKVEATLEFKPKATGLVGTIKFDAFDEGEIAALAEEDTAKKNLMLAVVPAKTVVSSVTGTGAAAKFDGLKEGTAFDKDAALDFKTATENKISASFFLEAATYSDAAAPLYTGMAAGEKGVGAFTIAGHVNPYAGWATADFTVNATYKLTAVPGVAVDDIKGSLAAGLHTMIDPNPAP